MNCIFQVVSLVSGNRSPAIMCSREDLANDLAKTFPLDVRRDSAIVVLVDNYDLESACFSQAPFMLVETFIELFSFFTEDVDHG